MEKIILKNDRMAVTILPKRGGKTASIFLKSRNFELLAQPPGGIYPSLLPGMPFHIGDASGFDDVFPSMGEGETEVQGELMKLPDHGMIWTAPMHAEQHENTVSLSWNCPRPSFRYEKRIQLEENRVYYQIVITNTSSHLLEGIWVCHCLMHDEEGVNFEFPEEARTAVNLIPGSCLGEAGREHKIWNSAHDFLHPPADNSAIKFYVKEPIRNGCCAANYPRSGIRVLLRFDPNALPFLGFWMTTGAYRGDRNFAFEPATGYYDTIACARTNGRLSFIPPSGQMILNMSIELIHLSHIG